MTRRVGGPIPSSSAPGTSLHVRLQPQPSSVAGARRQVTNLLEEAGRTDLAEPAVLLVSELVTNALLHAGTDIDLAAELDADGLLVEVGDGSPHLPSRRRYAATAGTGRGLMMLESMVDDWGVTLHRNGKTGWVRLSHQDGGSHEPTEPHTAGTPEANRRAARVPVGLRNMPPLLPAPRPGDPGA